MRSFLVTTSVFALLWFPCWEVPAQMEPPASPAPILVVFDVEASGLELAPTMLNGLADYLVTRLTESGRYQVVPRAQVRVRLAEAKNDTYKECYDESCQIELGRELAAQKSLAAKVVRLGSLCTVNLTVFDLRRAASESAASASGTCSEDGVVASVNAALSKLTGGAPGGSPSNEEGVEEAGKPPDVRVDAGQQARKPTIEIGRVAPEKVQFVLYAMSKCPFASQVETNLLPVLRKLGDQIDLRLEFIGDEPSPGKFTAMHGESEVSGDLLHLCALKHEPRRFLDLIVCMNQDLQRIPDNFDECASQHGVDAHRIQTCAGSREGATLLSDSYRRSKEREARGSPTMYINDERYQGGRTELDFLRAVCRHFTRKPSACLDIPEPMRIPLLVLSDKRCTTCNTDRILGQLKNMFPGLEPTEIDYATQEGRALYRRIADRGGKFLPAFLFDPVVSRDPGHSQIARYLSDVDTYKLLALGSKFDPLVEICDNGIDDDGNHRIDCEDDACKQTLLCRPVIPKNLKLFVMSLCPFGVRAEGAMVEVLDAFRDDGITFEIHYIADEKPDGSFNALHGQPEVVENIRQLCARRLYPKGDKWFAFIQCRNQDVRNPDWKPCARGLGMDVAAMDRCAKGEQGRALHARDIQLAKTLGIGASPTWVANNQHQFNGITAEAIKAKFCEHNPLLKGCRKRLSGDANGAGGAGGHCGAN